MKRTSIVVLIAAAMCLGVVFSAQSDTKMDDVYKKIKAESPLHVVVRLERVSKPKLDLGTCNVSGVITKVHKTVNSEWRRLKTIVFGIKCKQKDAVVSPKDPIQWVDAARLEAGTTVDAYLAPTKTKGTFEPVKFNLVRIISQQAQPGPRIAK